MQSSQAVTETFKLPRPCLCPATAPGLSYEQRLRIRRACINTVTTYDISDVEIEVAGSGYSIDDVLQLVGGYPAQQTGSAVVSSVDRDGVETITVLGTFAFLTPPTNPVDSVVVSGGSGSGATFNITWKSSGTGCCTCT